MSERAGELGQRTGELSLVVPEEVAASRFWSMREIPHIFRQQPHSHLKAVGKTELVADFVLEHLRARALQPTSPTSWHVSDCTRSRSPMRR